MAQNIMISIDDAEPDGTGCDKFHQGAGGLPGIIVIASHVGKAADSLRIGINCDHRNTAADQFIQFFPYCIVVIGSYNQSLYPFFQAGSDGG